MNKVIVTGATSFLGHVLTKTLLALGYQVYAIVRPSSKNLHILYDCPQAMLIKTDLADIESLSHCGIQADVFFHLGWEGVNQAQRDDMLIQDKNLQFSAACLRLAKALGCRRFVFTGSQAEYGITEHLRSEEDHCKPVTPYGQAKLGMLKLGLAFAAETGLDYVHGRIFSLYGPGDHPWSLISQCVRGFLANEAIPLSECLHKWNYLYVNDAARALIAISKIAFDQKYPIFNIASHDTRVLKHFIEDIHKQAGFNGVPLFGARESVRQQPYSMIPDVKKLMSTGWRAATPFIEGINCMMRAFE